MKNLKVYEYSNCSTCKKALKFLETRKIPFQKIPIVDTPPTKSEIKAMLGHLKGDIKKLFNTSGQMYRELKISEKIKKMTPDEAIALLAANGKLIKRPFVLTEKTGIVGFNEKQWEDLL